MKKTIALFTALLTLSVPAHAGIKDRIDLDNQHPAELLIQDEQGSSVVFWSVASEVWIELFRTSGEIEGFVEDPDSSLSFIKSDGRLWQWRNDAYVPQVSEEAIVQGPLSDEDYAAAAEFIGDFDQIPANSPVNMQIDMEYSGKVEKAALIASPIFCSLGGTNCPVVVFLGGKPSNLVYISLNQSWGFSEHLNANGIPLLESQQEKSLLLIDIETRTETIIEGIRPTKAEPQYPYPRDFD